MIPKLIVCAGPPCSGKSTLASALADRFDCRLLQVDRILSVLMPQSDWSEADRLVGYRAMLLTAGELVRCSRSVVLDATFTTAVCRDLLRSSRGEFRSETHIFQVRVSPDVAIRRFRARKGHAAIDLTESRVRELAENYPYSAQSPVLNGEAPVEEILQWVVRYIGPCEASETKSEP